MKTLIVFFKNLFTLSLLTGLFLNSCKCKKEEVVLPEYKLSGRVFISCNTPLANYPIVLHQGGTTTLTGPTDIYEVMTSTDSMGYFSVVFKNKGHGPIELHCDRNKILGGIPFAKNVSDIVAYQNATACIQLRLNVVNPHTINDTLVIADYAIYDDLRLPGPFQSGILYTATNFQILEPEYGGAQKSVRWHFNTYHGVYEKQPFLIDRYCNDTIFVTATIN